MSLKLTEGELRFKDNPIMIPFKVGCPLWDYGSGGLFVKSTCITTIPEMVYYKLIKDTFSESTYYHDVDVYNEYFRKSNGECEPITIEDYVVSPAFLELLFDTYGIREYMLVPAYYENELYEHTMLVSKNEFKYDFPEIGVKWSEPSDDINIGYLDEYLNCKPLIDVSVAEQYMDDIRKVMSRIFDEREEKRKNDLFAQLFSEDESKI